MEQRRQRHATYNRRLPVSVQNKVIFGRVLFLYLFEDTLSLVNIYSNSCPNPCVHQHANTIRTQITNNGEVKKQERLDYLEEGRKVRQRIEDERLKVERIKGEKLASLKTVGIADKYQADLSKKKILWTPY